MNLSLKWLADYVDCGVSVKEFCAGMTMSGSKVETYETEGEVVKNVIVGKLVSITPHENSDHLQVCQVDVGGDSPIQIVTGAQNIVEGALVPVANVLPTIVVTSLLSGAIVGGVGSMFSIRKHLNV